jgi:hypothetical protein
MKSIYIAVPSLYDPEYEHTLDDIFYKSSGKYEIHVGGAITTDDKDFYDYIVKRYQGKNAEFIHLDPHTEYGLGQARYHSMSLYQDQDYVMQCDAHTKFEQGWDDFVISLYEQAKKETGNPKTILTSYLGQYQELDGVRSVIANNSRYATFETNLFHGTIPRWAMVPVTDLDPIYHSKRFLPSNQYCGQFALSESHLALDYPIEKTALYMDEQLTLAISLIDKGYSLVYPNENLPMTHLWIGDPGYENRQKMEDLTNMPDHLKISSDNFKKFKKNRKRRKKFESYVGFKLKTGPKQLCMVPKEYS